MADGTRDMRPLYVTLVPFCLAGALTGVWLAPPAPTMTRNGPILPLAAAAWAEINCGAKLSRSVTVAPLQADDLRRVGAHFDDVRVSAGQVTACQSAFRAASGAIAHNAPAYRTEVLVSVALPVR